MGWVGGMYDKMQESLEEGSREREVGSREFEITNYELQGTRYEVQYLFCLETE